MTHRNEDQQLSMWSRENLVLNTTKTIEPIMDLKKKKPGLHPVLINGDCAEKLSDFRFLGVHSDDELSWKTNTSALDKKGQQRYDLLRILRKNHLAERLLLDHLLCQLLNDGSWSFKYISQKCFYSGSPP